MFLSFLFLFLQFFISFDDSCCAVLFFRCYTFSWPIFSGSLSNLDASLLRTRNRFFSFSSLCFLRWLFVLWTRIRLAFAPFKKKLFSIYLSIPRRNRVRNLPQNDKLVDRCFIVLVHLVLHNYLWFTTACGQLEFNSDIAKSRITFPLTSIVT